MIKGKGVYSIKSDCVDLGNICCFTQNRVIEKMGCCPDECREHLGHYLKSLILIDSLCKYISSCCCNMDAVSTHMVRELQCRKDKLMTCVKNIEKVCDKETLKYFKVDKVKMMCKACDKYSKYSKKSAKK